MADDLILMSVCIDSYGLKEIGVSINLQNGGFSNHRGWVGHKYLRYEDFYRPKSSRIYNYQT